ncbi:response regulator, partial [Deinococcus sp. GbtcB9]|uniref:response regulator n=1 Tax=Deinococcus sp. GbtcB9 TaxID=2824754 RepID=UPI001C2F4FF5
TSVRVRICEDGPSALAELRAQALPDVVILGLNMPRMSGFDVIREIRASAGLRHLPVVNLSTSGNADDEARAFDLLARSY